MSVTVARGGMYRGCWLLFSAHKGTAGPQRGWGGQEGGSHFGVSHWYPLKSPEQGTCPMTTLGRRHVTQHDNSAGLRCGNEATDLPPPGADMKLTQSNGIGPVLGLGQLPCSVFCLPPPLLSTLNPQPGWPWVWSEKLLIQELYREERAARLLIEGREGRQGRAFSGHPHFGSVYPHSA